MELLLKLGKLQNADKINTRHHAQTPRLARVEHSANKLWERYLPLRDVDVGV